MIQGKGEVEHLKQLNTLKFKKMQKFSFQRIELEVVCNIINTFQHNFVLHVVLIRSLKCCDTYVALFWGGNYCFCKTCLFWSYGSLTLDETETFEANTVLKQIPHFFVLNLTCYPTCHQLIASSIHCSVASPSPCWYPRGTRLCVRRPIWGYMRP